MIVTASGRPPAEAEARSSRQRYGPDGCHARRDASCAKLALVTLTIALLGAPRVEVDGLPLRVDTRKAVALLAYLAVTGHAQSRDRLALLLWPDYDDDRARAALRRTLSTLKTALAGEWLAVDRAAVSLAPGAQLDVSRFRELATPQTAADEIPWLTQAVALHRDDLLAGFGLRDSVEFDHWQQSTAAELRRELSTALGRLTAALTRADRYDEAIPHARRRLALDPLDEQSHRRLIELLAATGKRAEALRQYRECVRLLDRELGVRPLPETTELYQAVNEGRLAASAPPSPLPAPAPPRMLAGREREWAQLVAAHAACNEDGCTVLLEGEAGIGKTRLGEQHVSYARSLGGLPWPCDRIRESRRCPMASSPTPCVRRGPSGTAWSSRRSIPTPSPRPRGSCPSSPVTAGRRRVPAGLEPASASTTASPRCSLPCSPAPRPA